MKKGMVGLLGAVLVLSLGTVSAFAAPAVQGHGGKCSVAVWAREGYDVAEHGACAYRAARSTTWGAQKSVAVDLSAENAGGDVTPLQQVSWGWAGTAEQTVTGQGSGYVDGNGDGVCDNLDTGYQGGYVDADGDGVCDRADSRGWGGGYVDEDGDGVCDNLGSGTRPQDGTGYRRGNGNRAGGHRGGRG